MGQRRKKIKARQPNLASQSQPVARVELEEPVANPQLISVVARPTEETLQHVDYGPMARDLRRVLVVVVVVLAVLAGLIITNRSTGWLNHQADRLSHWLQLS